MTTTGKTDTNVVPLSDAGVPITVDANGYATLVAGATYFYPLSEPGDLVQSAHVQWDIAAILTITFADTNQNEVTPFSVVAGRWIQENPLTAYIPVLGGTATGMTVAVPGGTAGGAMYNISGAGTKRSRLKIVVGGTGGVVRVSKHGKE